MVHSFEEVGSNRSMKPIVELYSTDACGLCTETRTILTELQSRIPFELREVKLTPDDPKYAHYFTSVPVIVINDRHQIRAPIDPNQVARLLRRATGRGMVETAGIVLKWLSVLVAVVGIVIRLMGEPELGYLIFAAALLPFVVGRLLLRRRPNAMSARAPRDLQQDNKQ